MGGHVGELLELGVRAAEVDRLGLELVAGEGDLAQLGKDPLAHLLHGEAEGLQLAGPDRGDRVVELATRHDVGIGAEGVERLAGPTAAPAARGCATAARIVSSERNITPTSR